MVFQSNVFVTLGVQKTSLGGSEYNHYKNKPNSEKEKIANLTFLRT